MAALGPSLPGDGDGFPFGWISLVYAGLGLLTAGSAVLGFMAYGRAKAGDARGAWVRGLVAALLPPLQVVPLVGALLCLLCPEGEAQGRPRAAQVP
jgi:hypothetical protein